MFAFIIPELNKICGTDFDVAKKCCNNYLQLVCCCCCCRANVPHIFKVGPRFAFQVQFNLYFHIIRHVNVALSSFVSGRFIIAACICLLCVCVCVCWKEPNSQHKHTHTHTHRAPVMQLKIQPVLERAFSKIYQASFMVCICIIANGYLRMLAEVKSAISNIIFMPKQNVILSSQAILLIFINSNRTTDPNLYFLGG